LTTIQKYFFKINIERSKWGGEREREELVHGRK
jgi:hypothetical protein